MKANEHTRVVAIANKFDSLVEVDSICKQRLALFIIRFKIDTFSYKEALFMIKDLKKANHTTQSVPLEIELTLLRARLYSRQVKLILAMNMLHKADRYLKLLGATYLSPEQLSLYRAEHLDILREASLASKELINAHQAILKMSKLSSNFLDNAISLA